MHTFVEKSVKVETSGTTMSEVNWQQVTWLPLKESVDFVVYRFIKLKYSENEKKSLSWTLDGCDLQALQTAVSTVSSSHFVSIHILHSVTAFCQQLQLQEEKKLNLSGPDSHTDHRLFTGCWLPVPRGGSGERNPYKETAFVYSDIKPLSQRQHPNYMQNI